MKQLRYILEAIVLYIFYGVCAVLPPATASNLGGIIGRTIGPRLAASRKAFANLDLALPEKTPDEKRKIIADMWDNLGRVMAEYPHLEKIGKNGVRIINQDIITHAANNNQGGVFIAAHQGNWEANTPALLLQGNVPSNLTYRAANNPFSDWLLEKARTLGGRIRVIPKARSSAKDLMEVMKNKEFMGVMIDQKYNEGIPVKFFGAMAMTNPVAVKLCQKYDVPLIPTRNRRTGPAQFEITLEQPMQLFTNDGTPLPVEQILETANRFLEQWIREEPGQWLWLHRRWDSNALN